MDEVSTPALTAQPANDDDGFLGGIGVRWFGKNGGSGSIEYTRIFSRDDIDYDTFSILFRKEF